ncbi:hypothetical protein SO802_021472 [Lithocarpus litseifolius]|uniref:Uncharacterized protein n=1 Tax=Lithocarpus litseifolius TaxID=425828 RepID=A0AAW2CF83_9ROSI
MARIVGPRDQAVVVDGYCWTSMVVKMPIPQQCFATMHPTFFTVHLQGNFENFWNERGSHGYRRLSLDVYWENFWNERATHGCRWLFWMSMVVKVPMPLQCFATTHPTFFTVHLQCNSENFWTKRSSHGCRWLLLDVSGGKNANASTVFCHYICMQRFSLFIYSVILRIFGTKEQAMVADGFFWTSMVRIFGTRDQAMVANGFCLTSMAVKVPMPLQCFASVHPTFFTVHVQCNFENFWNERAIHGCRWLFLDVYGCISADLSRAKGVGSLGVGECFELNGMIFCFLPFCFSILCFYLFLSFFLPDFLYMLWVGVEMFLNKAQTL